MKPKRIVIEIMKQVQPCLESQCPDCEYLRDNSTSAEDIDIECMCIDYRNDCPAVEAIVDDYEYLNYEVI